MDRGTRVLQELVAQSEQRVELAEKSKARFEAAVQEKRDLFSEGLILVKGDLTATYMREVAGDLMTAVARLSEITTAHDERLYSHSKLVLALGVLTDGAE